MKKIITAILLVAILLFSACSCNNASLLSLSVSSMKENEKVEITYDVNLDKNYSFGGYSFAKSSDIPDSAEYEIKGTYTITAQLISKLSSEIPDYVKNSCTQVLDRIGDVLIFKTISKLTLNVKYGTYQNTDTINVESYFANNNYVSPIYARTDSIVTYVTYSDNQFVAEQSKGSLYTVIYGTESYTIRYYDYSKKDTPDDLGDVLSESSTSYTFGTTIDNSAFLYAMTLISPAKSSSIILPTVSNTYDKPQNILATYFEDTSFENSTQLPIIPEGQTDVTVNAKVYNYNISSSSAQGCSTNSYTGQSQLVFVQNGEKNYIPLTGVMLQYVSPIFCTNSTFSQLGGLVYKLKDMTKK